MKKYEKGMVWNGTYHPTKILFNSLDELDKYVNSYPDDMFSSGDWSYYIEALRDEWSTISIFQIININGKEEKIKLTEGHYKANVNIV